MNRGAFLGTVLVLASTLSLDCNQEKPADVEAVRNDKPVAKRPGATPMPDQEVPIPDASLARCVESKGVIALVRIDHAEVRAPGTRSEAAWFRATVERALHGKPEHSVEFWCYTREGDKKLAEGSKYVVAVSGSGAGFVPQTMMGHMAVAPGDEDKVVKVYEEAIRRLTATP